MANDCSSVVPPVGLALGLVDQAHTKFMTLGNEVYAAAQQQYQNVSSFVSSIEPTYVTVTFDDVAAVGAPRRPPRPSFDGDLDFHETTTPPDAPVFPGGAGAVALEPIPEFTEPVPVISFSPRPNPTNPTKPVMPTGLFDHAVPDDVEFSQAPDLVPVVFPGSITIPPFTATPPDTSELPDPDLSVFTFSPEWYVSDLLDKVRAKVSWMLDGGTGLPAAVQEALWARAKGRVDLEEQRIVQQTIDEFATRGFTTPNGILNRRIDQARQSAMNQRLGLSRDLVIEEANLEQKNLQFAVQQGVALESQFAALWMQFQELLLKGASALLDASIKVYEAKLTQRKLAYDLFRSQYEAWKTDIEARVEVFRAEVEAAKAAGDYNEQLARLFDTKIRAETAQMDAAIRLFVAKYDADGKKLDAFRAETGAYAEFIRANAAQWDAWGREISAEAAKVQPYEAASRAYAARVSAVDTANRGKIEEARLEIQAFEAEMRAFTDGTLRNIGLALQAEESRVRAVAAKYGALGQVYNADANVEQAISAAHDRRYGLDIQKSTSAAQIATENARAAMQEHVSLTQMQLQAVTTLAQLMTQMTAGVFSAVNYSAGVSLGESKSESRSANFQCE